MPRRGLRRQVRHAGPERSGIDRTRSSAVEHYVDIVGVTGSIPVASTISLHAAAGEAPPRTSSRFQAARMPGFPPTLIEFSPLLLAKALTGAFRSVAARKALIYRNMCKGLCIEGRSGEANGPAHGETGGIRGRSCVNVRGECHLAADGNLQGRGSVFAAARFRVEETKRRRIWSRAFEGGAGGVPCRQPAGCHRVELYHGEGRAGHAGLTGIIKS